MQRCLSSPESSGDASLKAVHHDDMQTLPATPHLPLPTLLLREWAKFKLTSSSWKDALAAAVVVSLLLLRHPSLA